MMLSGFIKFFVGKHFVLCSVFLLSFLLCFDVAFAQQDLNPLSMGGLKNELSQTVLGIVSIIKWVVRVIGAGAVIYVAFNIISILLSNNRAEGGEAQKPINKLVVALLGIVAVIVLVEVVSKYLMPNT